jgi:hypothetical protein
VDENMTDIFKQHMNGLESPASRAHAVQPDDSADLPLASRALNVAEAGLVQVTTISGTTAQIFIAAGIPFPIRVARVWATGTTATGIVSLT